jgi:hypothetical protein
MVESAAENEAQAIREWQGYKRRIKNHPKLSNQEKLEALRLARKVEEAFGIKGA